MISLKSLYTNQLDNDLIKKIFLLKKEQWNYSLNQQNLWFKKNVKPKDIHNCLFVGKNLIGYTLLRKRSYIKKNSRMKYFFFDTLIIKKNHKKKGMSYILMALNNYQINRHKTISILACNKEMESYYKKFGWELDRGKKISFQDYYIKKKNRFMSYGIKPVNTKFFFNK